jgi:phage terminase large subunit GpA-like protein
MDPEWTRVNGKMGKDTLFARLVIPDPGPRYMHFPKGHGYTEDFFQQITAEVLKTDFRRGFPTQHYEKIRDRNEALDIRVYLLAAIDILNPSLTRIAARLKPATGEPQSRDYALKPGTPAAPAKQGAPRQRIKIKVGGFGSKF